ncbi:MAG: HesB/YadR/YfhF-family protein [Acidobacteria bacterium]|nr:MAG: HesB/YadR/YfhF-family protein [Acidobacteriota bacterium]
MLTVTENAQEVVRGLTSDETMPDSAGLRLALAEDPTQLEVSVVQQPEATDQVVEGTSVPVYVAENATEVLDDKTLDAAQTEQGVGFTLAPQATA